MINACSWHKADMAGCTAHVRFSPKADIPQRIVANTCTSTSPGYRHPALGLDPSGYDGVSPRARNVN